MSTQFLLINSQHKLDFFFGVMIVYCRVTFLYYLLFIVSFKSDGSTQVQY